jgi:sigma-B regulation protein RsbU (phosphoserine phosphatase)
LENGAEPSAILSSVESIIRLAGNTRTLMTMLHCQFDLDENKVEIANAGHIYPLFYSKRLDRVEWIETPPAYPLGVKQQGKFEVLQFSVEPGDLLVLVSDGFIESRNEEGECFDYGRLKNAVETTERKAPDSVAEHVIQRIRDFVGSAQQDDDLTMVIIGYKLNQG